MKIKVRNLLSVFLIIIGIGLLIFAFKGKWETKKVQEELYDKFMILNESDENIKNINEENQEKPQEITYYTDKIDPIAILEIPKINLNVVVAAGVEDDVIRYAVGHFEDTVMPGEQGNCALAGHRNYDTGEFFLRLNKLESGDDIIISTHEDTYKYKVTTSFTVAPEDTYVLDSSQEAIVTLVTCTYDGKERLIVQGKKVD
ncbi:class D sortase [Clostridium sp.]|uniref:class D sortase n=1 Tax=Clostridium sp. TaxID=1506 RepID=UPI0032170002